MLRAGLVTYQRRHRQRSVYVVRGEDLSELVLHPRLPVGRLAPDRLMDSGHFGCREFDVTVSIEYLGGRANPDLVDDDVRSAERRTDLAQSRVSRVHLDCGG